MKVQQLRETIQGLPDDADIVVFFGENVGYEDTGVVVDMRQSAPDDLQSLAIIITVDF